MNLPRNMAARRASRLVHPPPPVSLSCSDSSPEDRALCAAPRRSASVAEAVAGCDPEPRFEGPEPRQTHASLTCTSIQARQRACSSSLEYAARRSGARLAERAASSAAKRTRVPTSRCAWAAEPGETPSSLTRQRPARITKSQKATVHCYRFRNSCRNLFLAL